MPKAKQVVKPSNRRAFLKQAPAVAAAAAIAAPASARAQAPASEKPEKKVHYLNLRCNFSSSALPGHRSSYGICVSGVATVSLCSCRSLESGEM